MVYNKSCQILIIYANICRPWYLFIGIRWYSLLLFGILWYKLVSPVQQTWNSAQCSSIVAVCNPTLSVSKEVVSQLYYTTSRQGEFTDPISTAFAKYIWNITAPTKNKYSIRISFKKKGILRWLFLPCVGQYGFDISFHMPLILLLETSSVRPLVRLWRFYPI